jgi:hypothetical protein
MPVPWIRRVTAGLIIVLAASGGCATDSRPTTTTLAAPLVTLELTEEGLGDVLVGYPPDVVIADISALFGSPDHDSEWIASEPNIYGTCPGRFMRAVGWGSLVVIFVNDTADPLDERFFTYSYGYDYSGNAGGVDPRGLGLVTETGIGIGSTVKDLEDTYGSRVTIDGDATLDVWSFEIEESRLRGLLDGPKPDSKVTLIELTPNCG